MTDNIKRLLFVTSGLIIIAASAFFYKSHYAEAAIQEGKKFDDWVVGCTKIPHPDKPDTQINQCFLTQSILLNQDNDKDQKSDKQQVIAIYQIGYFGNDKTLTMIQILPLGIRVDAGTSIISSKDLLSTGRFSTCINTGCHAHAAISEEDLQKIMSSSENSVAYMNIQGKQVTIPLSTKGLEKGLAYLRK